MREMKDSGIEWIGEIPVEWDVLRNKNSFTCTKELVGEKSSDTQLLSLTTKGVRKKDINNAEGKLPESFDTYQYVKENDIIMCLFDLDCSAVFSGISFYDGMISPAYRVLTCTDKTFPKYAGYWFNYISHDRKFNHYAKNIRYTLSYEEFSALPIVVPPYKEQQAISTYLDTKCEKIDSIIARQQEVIEKLKAYKLSVITEAVTKGLNPDVRMKDSGVEWIGDVPEHWMVCRIANLYTERNEKGNEELPVLTVSINTGVSDRELSDDESQRVFWRSEDKTKYKAVYPDDLTYNMMRAWQGAFGAVRVYGMVSPAYVVAKPTTEIESRYIEALLRTSSAKQEMQRYSHGIADFRLRLYWEKFRNIKVCIPPLQEQIAIANYLDTKYTAIDSAIAKKQAIIEKLTAYKKSLIYEVVTGKREVNPQKEEITVVCPIGIPTNEEEYARILLLQKIITTCGNHLKGRTHLMKIFHAIELGIGFSFNTEYARHYHGPYDKHIENYENALVRKGWIKLKKGKNIEYTVTNSTAYKSDYKRIFGKYNKEIERIIDFFKSMKRTSKAEKVATLLASWNDFLIDGIAAPDDNMIISDVMNNWTENKGHINHATWQEILNQMKKENIIPHGYCNHTIKAED